MSDPLATTTQTLDAIKLSEHPVRYRSEAEVRSLTGTKASKDLAEVGRLLESKKVDVVLLRGIKQIPTFCADAQVLKRMEGRKAGEVMLSSSTASLEVRHVVPRLQATVQGMYDAMPASCSQWPVSPAGVTKAAASKTMVGGGTQYALGRICQYAPKRGVTPASPFEAAEVVGALMATGRRVPTPEKTPLALTEEQVKFNADSDNGFPVGGTMRDPFAQSKCLELAGQINNRLRSGRFSVAQGVQVLLNTAPEISACKGKVKTDVYALDKVAARGLRFYNVVGRQLVLLMQRGTQPLADSWKENARADWTTGIGKGFAFGRADEMVRWLDKRLETEGIAWSHTGDDTLVVRVWVDKGQRWAEVFSLDCSSFDLTQHSDTTRYVHALVGQQLIAVDEVAGELWKSLARERIVTIAGSLPVKTSHWGVSGMPLQSEVNDTLMECLLRRVKARTWHDKETLASVLAEEGGKVGFQVRLEDHFKAQIKDSDAPLRTLLSRRPFLYLGYYLYEDEGKGIAACLDIQRFFAGAAYLSGGYVEKSAVGAKVALALAGYTLSFGVPPAFFEPAWRVLQQTALAALEAVGNQLTPDEIEAEVGRHVFAGLPRIAELKGLMAAVGQEPRVIWLGDQQAPVDIPLGAWADEPWVKEAATLFAFADPKLNDVVPTTTNLAGRLPPTPQRVLEEREAKAERRQEAEVERKRTVRRVKRGGRAGDDVDSEDADYDEESDEQLLDDDDPRSADVHYADREEWEEFSAWKREREQRDRSRKDLL